MRSPFATHVDGVDVTPEPPDRSERPYGAGRATPQRQVIASTAAARGGSFSVDELATDVCVRDPTIGAATVYRAVAAMLASGWIERVGERHGSALFARCSEGGRHHHHLVCDRCGRVATTECPLGDNTTSAAQRSGFVITRHEVTLYGLCPDCAPSARDEA